MKWLVQQGNTSSKDYTTLIETLQRAGLDWESVVVIPFSDRFVVEPQLADNKVFAWGAYTMHEIAQKRNWIPGVFSNENFDYQVLVDKLGDEMLNSDAKFLPFGRVKIDKPMFIRPVLDSKSFVGNVYSPTVLKDWQNSIAGLNGTWATLKPKTQVLVAEPKTILKEYRFFIVDGKISTYSLYKWGKQSYFSHELVGQDVIEYVQKIINIWQPAKAFVLDVAMTYSEDLKSYDFNTFKVIEINSLTGCGFYDADVSKLIQDLMILIKKYD